jgi:DNA sulfur modification protein DndE
MIETVRLSEKGRSQLITLKRRTGIAHWNVLCRWAFCLSLKEASVPPNEEIPADSSVEMSWRVFTGGQEALYWSLLVQRAHADGVDLSRESLTRYFRLHLHRGISYLVGKSGMQGIEDLVQIASEPA